MFVAIGYFWLIRQTFIILTFVLVAKYFGEAVLPPRLVRPRATAPVRYATANVLLINAKQKH